MLAVFIFALDYGLLFWAEQHVSSGTAAVMLATIPAFMALSEILFLRTRRLTLRLAIALLVGLAGVLVLVSHSLGLGEAPIDRRGAVALLVAGMSWSIASALTRKMTLPESKAMSSAAQMLCGGVFLLVASSVLGEFQHFHWYAVSGKVWWALVYHYNEHSWNHNASRRLAWP